MAANPAKPLTMGALGALPSLRVVCLLVLVPVCLSAWGSQAAPATGKRQFFSSCVGWGASCSTHRASWSSYPRKTPAAAPASRGRPAPAPQPRPGGYSGGRTTKNRLRPAIRILFSSGGWDAGMMGKRRDTRRENDRLLEQLRRAVTA